MEGTWSICLLGTHLIEERGPVPLKQLQEPALFFNDVLGHVVEL